MHPESRHLHVELHVSIMANDISHAYFSKGRKQIIYFWPNYFATSTLGAHHYDEDLLI